MSIFLLCSNVFCTNIQQSTQLEKKTSKKIIKEQKKKNTKKENILSEEDLKRLIDSAYTPKKIIIKDVDQDKDIIFFEEKR